MSSRMGHVAGRIQGKPLRRGRALGCAVADALERRLLLSASITTIAAFNGVNGSTPTAAVEDTAGNLFGVTDFTTNDGGNTFGPGVVFEIPAGTSTINDLGSLTLGTGTTNAQGDSVIIDSAGNVYGTETDLIAQTGKIFEVAAGSGTVVPLASFAPHADGNVTAVDSAGDLFGITNGQPFELVKGSGSVTMLPASPENLVDLEMGPDGNLYGVGAEFGSNGIIIKISLTNNNALTTLASIDSTVGTSPTGITFDSAGNLWGFCQNGGASNGGSIFELPAGGGTVTAAASFTSTAGINPLGSPAFDDSGNLWGLTANGAANDDGALIEFPAAGSAISRDAVHPDQLGGAIAGYSFGDQQSLSGGGNIVTNTLKRIANVAKKGVKIVGGLFGANSDSDGAIDDFVNSIPVQHDPPPLLRPLYKLLGKDLDALAGGLAAAFISRPGQPIGVREAEAMIAAAVGKNGIATHLVRPESPAARALVSPHTKHSPEFNALEAMIKTARHELNVAAPLVNKQAALTTQYNREVNLITALDHQLAAATKASVIAAIQKKLTADGAVATRLLNQDTAVYNTANAELGNVSTLEDNIRTTLAGLTK